MSIFLLLGLVLCVQGELIGTKEEDESFLTCVLEDNSVGCLSTRLGRNLDQIEMQVTGKKSETPMSAVIEQAGNFMAEVIDDVQNPGRSEEVAETADASDQGENRDVWFLAVKLFIASKRYIRSINEETDEAHRASIGSARGAHDEINRELSSVPRAPLKKVA